MEHHGPNCNSNVTTPVVISQVLPHFTREACQARCCSPKAGYWGKGSNNIPFSPVQHFSPQNELFFLVRSCKRLQGSAGLHSRSIKKGGFLPPKTTQKKNKKGRKAKVVSSSCSSEMGHEVRELCKAIQEVHSRNTGYLCPSFAQKTCLSLLARKDTLF